MSLLRSKIDYGDHFSQQATHWTHPVQDVTVYKFLFSICQVQNGKTKSGILGCIAPTMSEPQEFLAWAEYFQMTWKWQA